MAICSYIGGRTVLVKPVNAVDVATEATILAAPAAGSWTLVGACLLNDEGGEGKDLVLQASGETTDLVVLPLQDGVPRDFDLGPNGVNFGNGKAIQADGATSSNISGFLLVVNEPY